MEGELLHRPLDDRVRVSDLVPIGKHLFADLNHLDKRVRWRFRYKIGSVWSHIEYGVQFKVMIGRNLKILKDISFFLLGARRTGKATLNIVTLIDISLDLCHIM